MHCLVRLAWSAPLGRCGPVHARPEPGPWLHWSPSTSAGVSLVHHAASAGGAPRQACNPPALAALCRLGRLFPSPSAYAGQRWAVRTRRLNTPQSARFPSAACDQVQNAYHRAQGVQVQSGSARGTVAHLQARAPTARVQVGCPARSQRPKEAMQSLHHCYAKASSFPHKASVVWHAGTSYSASMQTKSRSSTVPPNPSIEGTCSGLRPPHAPHVKR